ARGGSAGGDCDERVVAGTCVRREGESRMTAADAATRATEAAKETAMLKRLATRRRRPRRRASSRCSSASTSSVDIDRWSPSRSLGSIGIPGLLSQQQREALACIEDVHFRGGV